MYYTPNRCDERGEEHSLSGDPGDAWRKKRVINTPCGGDYYVTLGKRKGQRRHGTTQLYESRGPAGRWRGGAVVSTFWRPRTARKRWARALGRCASSCIVKTINSPYWAIVLAAAKKAAKDLGVQGLSFTGGPSEADINAEVNLLENAIAKKVDFIVLRAHRSRRRLNAAIDKAYNAGIKVILIDSSATTDNYHAFLSTDNMAGGLACADALAASIKAKHGSAAGQIAYATFQSNVGSLGDARPGLPGRHQEVSRPEDRRAQGCRRRPQLRQEASIAADTITAFPNLVGYLGDNLQCVEGAATAFKEKGVRSEEGLPGRVR